MLKNILLVGFGGFTGTIARYLIYLLIDKNLSSSFPWSTFIVNIVGSLLLGLFAGLFFRHHINESTRLLVAIGFCGSFTTFSTFAYENMLLINQKPLLAAIYILSSITFGVAAIFLGYGLGKHV